MKCDIVIPVYNAPEWVSLCVKLAIEHTPKESLHKILLIDDGSSAYTQEVLQDLAGSDSRISVHTNEQNVGFIKSVNRGMALTTAPYILLLNSDCLLTPNVIPKLMSHARKEKNVGLISPISNNSPVVTFEMLPGYSFLQMNAILEKLFSGISVDACTIVGNCLLISQECFNKVGYFDELYGKGYGEETDYQFKALEKGFEAKIALDTYVYHKAEVSFGKSQKTEDYRQQNHKLFMERWQREYQTRFSAYKEHEPIALITQETQKYLCGTSSLPESDVLVYLPGISQKIGGVHNVIDIVNALILNGIHATLVTSSMLPFHEVMLTQPVIVSEEDFIENRLQIQCKAIVATAWNTVYPSYLFAKKNGLPLIYLVQGYEVFFENGRQYRAVRETYPLADRIITISQWLSDNLRSRFAVPSVTFPNGYNPYIFYAEDEQLSNNTPIITMVLRGSEVKGDWILQDVLQLLLKEYGHHIQLYVIVFDRDECFYMDDTTNVHIIKAPLSKQQISNIFRKTSIFVDASLHEGFGLFPLEAMACGAVVVASDSGGIREFLHDGINGLLIRKVNKPEKYIEKIRSLLEDNVFYCKLRKRSLEMISTYNSTKTLQRYVEFFSSLQTVPIKPKNKQCPINQAYRERYWLCDKKATQEIQVSGEKFSQCFIGQESKFSEEHSVVHYVTGEEKYLEFDLTSYEHVNAFRFDPFNDAVVLKLSSIKITTKDGNEYVLSKFFSNACSRTAQELIFSTHDPQIYCSFPRVQCPRTLRIELEFIAFGNEIESYLSPPYSGVSWRNMSERYHFIFFKIQQWFAARFISHEK